VIDYYRRMTIVFRDEDVFEAVRELAEEEMRSTQDQVAYIVWQEMIKLGKIKSNVCPDNISHD